MMRRMISRILWAAFLSFSIAAFCCPVFAAGNRKDGDALAGLPVLADVEMYPIGDAEVVVGFKGKGLPEPETIFNVNRVRITFKEVRLDASDLTDRSVTVPMLSSVSTLQVSRDVVIEMTAESPLQLRSMRGVAPADSYTLRFITSAKAEKIVQEPAATRVVVKKPVPTGPFASMTPITLDLRDTELRDVFRMLGAHLKKNIIIDPSLPPALVTMTLKNVPLSEAFAYLMKTYDISYHMVGKDDRRRDGRWSCQDLRKRGDAYL